MRLPHTDHDGRLSTVLSAWRGIAGSLLIASPLLFGIPVAHGIVLSVVNVLHNAHPYLGWATTINTDAEQLYLGHTLYQDPAHGYTGMLYTPLFPVLISLLDHLYLWNGWGLLLVIGATVSLVALVARIAYSPTGPAPSIVRILAAVGIGGIAYWCLTDMELPLLLEARGDQVAWAFALFGLVAVADFGPAPSRRRVVLAALLLSAAFWAKQSTVGVAILAGAWVFGLAAVSALSAKTARLFVTVLAGVNLALLLVLNLLTAGWELYFNFEMSLAQESSSDYGPLVVNGAEAGELAIAFVCVTWLAVAVAAVAKRRRRAPPGGRRRPVGGGLRSLLVADDPTGRRALLFGLYIVFGFVLAVYFRRKQGSLDNQFIGVVWTLGLLAAVGWRVAQRNAAAAIAAGVCVALFFLVQHVGSIRNIAVSAGVDVPGLEQIGSWREVPEYLRSWASDHRIYTPAFSDLNVPQGGPLYPDNYDIADLLAAGRQPTYLVQALLDRRFDDVEPFGVNNLYTSAYGKWEENYLWKVDEVIAARYVAAPGLPPGLLERRPGPEQAAWMRRCFGPFAAGGASFRIGHGGGFWCSFSPNRLSLVQTPAPLSEVLTTQPARASGTITVGFEGRPSQAELVLERGGTPVWTARVTTSATNAHDLVVSTYLGGAALGSTTVTTTALPDGVGGVRLGLTPTHGRPGAPLPAGRGAATLTAPATRSTFALIATNGTDVDLSGMYLGG